MGVELLVTLRPLHMRLFRGSLAVGAIVISAGCSQSGDSGRFDTSDLHRFLTAYATAVAGDSTCTWLEPYLREGSVGLRAYVNKHEVSHGDICRATHRRPERYASLASKAPAFDALADSLSPLYALLDSLVPDRPRPAIYVLVGHGISLGSVTSTSPPRVLLGAELAGNTSGLARLVAHELFHTYQDYPLVGSLTGGPAFLRPFRGTILRHSIAEGAADLFAEVAAGPAPEDDRRRYGDAHESEVWAAFQRDLGSKSYQDWLFNGWRRDSLGGRPPDLGYYVGYRIAKSYYDRAPDKLKALRDICRIRDFPAFLVASGYHGTHN